MAAVDFEKSDVEGHQLHISNSDDDTLQDSPVDQQVDTVHGDEANRVLAGYSGPREWSPEEEKRLVRKVDRKLLIVLVLTYGLQYYDKAMLSHAALFGLRQDLDLLIGNRYSMSAAIFYLGFIAGAYPAVFLSQRYPIERVVSGIVLVWGVCLMTTAALDTYRGLYTQRFFLGFLESGVSPGWMMVVGSWYTKREQAFRMGVWFCATGYVAVISPLINYGLGHIHGALSPWRYMFLVAGAITIIWAFVVLLTMPADPVRAKGFTDRERFIAVARLRENNSGVRNTHFKVEQVKELALDVKFWLVFLIAFFMLFVNGPVSTFMPIIINQLGFSGFNSLLLTMPAGVVIGTSQLMTPWLAMKYKGIRCWLMIATTAVSLLGSLLLWQLPISAKGGRLFAVYILSFVGGGYATLLGLTVANCAGYTKRSLSSSGVFIGYCLGNFVGPLIFYENEAPEYDTGWSTVVSSLVVTMVLTVVYRFVCLWDNKRRDKEGVEAFDHAYEDDFTDLTNKQFRYTV